MSDLIEQAIQKLYDDPLEVSELQEASHSSKKDKKMENVNITSDELVINVCELAKRLNLSRSNAYKLTRRADFPVLKIGKRRLIPILQLQTWISNNLENA